MNADLFIKISEFLSLIAGWIVFYYVLKKMHVDARIKEYIETSKITGDYDEQYIKDYSKHLHMQCIFTVGGFVLITSLGKYFGFISVLIASVIYTWILVKVLNKHFPEPKNNN